MKCATLLDILRSLGVKPSHSRPRVSNHSALMVSAFRGCMYRPDYPADGFGTIEDARSWVWRFLAWYNDEHRHSGIKDVTPAQRRCGEVSALLQRRLDVYEAAREHQPQRGSGAIRDWLLVGLNPDRAADCRPA